MMFVVAFHVANFSLFIFDGFIWLAKYFIFIVVIVWIFASFLL